VKTTLLTSIRNFTHRLLQRVAQSAASASEAVKCSQLSSELRSTGYTFIYCTSHIKSLTNSAHQPLCKQHNDTKDSKYSTNTQSHKPTMSSVYCGRCNIPRLFTGTNVRYVTFTQNVSSQTAVYVHFSTPIMEQSSESY